MAKLAFEKYVTPSKKTGWVMKKGAARAAKPGKSPRQKMLEAIDVQMAAYKKGEVTKGSWFRAHEDGDVVKGQVRYGTQALQLIGDTPYMEMSANMLDQFYADLRTAVEGGKLDQQLEELSRKMSAARKAK